VRLFARVQCGSLVCQSAVRFACLPECSAVVNLVPSLLVWFVHRESGRTGSLVCQSAVRFACLPECSAVRLFARVQCGSLVCQSAVRSSTWCRVFLCGSCTGKAAAQAVP
ncbi:unnamed protein product, partial [Polarella glacialis]